MLHKYQPDDALACLRSQKVTFVGDSVTRLLYFQFAQVIDSNLPAAPPDDEQKHADHSLISDSGIQIDFIWDPFLNTSLHQLFVDPSPSSSANWGTEQDSAMIVLGSGLWYLRYANSSGSLSAWEANISGALNMVRKAYPKSTKNIVILPVEEVVPEKLTVDRYETLRPSDIDAMNYDLSYLIKPSLSDHTQSPIKSIDLPVSFPLVFNHMLDSSQTEDGLHFSDSVVRTQANILFNLQCNDLLPKTSPLDKTCCRSYPKPRILQLVVLAAVVLWGPFAWSVSRKSKWQPTSVGNGGYSALTFSAAIGVIFIADRTGFWLKEQKEFDVWIFTFLSLASLAVGLVKVKHSDKDPGFLSREQTEEWKGWMQISILIYHYLGASKIPAIYNPIRVLVASYLFMTGYGHTTFYIKKADFGLLRIAQVMIRLNILTLTLAYTMNTDYLSYYFSPLVSMWFFIIYGTMALGSRFNNYTPFVVFKIIASMGIVTWFFKETWLLNVLFDFLERIFAIHWSAREWTFRVTLDQFIVYFGMLAALAVIKIREHRLTDHVYWPPLVKIANGLSAIILLCFLSFALTEKNKVAYNAWHPYISILPIASFVTLRNANPVLRSASSRAFAFVGTCSLETFIIQFHLWLAADTKGLLMMIPGENLRPVNFLITSIIFIYVSHQVARATGDITNWICGGPEKSLPTARSSSSPTRSPRDEPRSSMDGPKESEASTLGRGYIPWQWVDRLGGDFLAGQKLGIKTKLALGVAVMWVVNILWTSF
ncbi:hypothetical protein SERLA73DRAFT_76503 [Serpula lacrymans var. lacrymans S7.3]|uniref:Cas1p 10 TM acyl transferase domain-containing protein n=2 Tax=Serpula lacrymans var. lacrymans TaxID=341189 RepID=F8Q753_SERL3|nr:uncharacterized protein SERLADRAFT_441316 [Serpula lacrymans var. lacrymans S7.9]EGN95391.1 hypothetical protein SERLA73DRAFT_76503 [Serpula lacrymans var. lacrymans S7.3]EGO20925.1 hypothetical protein SERLADRAFT_441316 [Serpula lacrymans var. lacrymans S7.9]